MNPSETTLQKSIRQQRKALSDSLQKPLIDIAKKCVTVWSERKGINSVFIDAIKDVPNCKYLYAMDTRGIQVSDNISHEGVIDTDFKRDRSSRPYMVETRMDTDFLLSEAYISLRVKRPSLTAVQSVREKNGNLLGFIGADFDLRDLPLTRDLYEEPRYWRQIKGDPSIRGTVFHQTRSDSIMDQKLDVILSVIEELMTDRGIFHVILHFSSNRAIIWQMDDPYRYRLLDIDELTDPDICLAYPRRNYPEDAIVSINKIRPILDGFQRLRFMDEMFYLRSGTVNIFNGIVGLTFSCDGSHYIPYDEFLNQEHTFWTILDNGSKE